MAVHRIRRLAALALVLTVGACATHQASPAFRRAVLIGDRGISVPLPPPSFIEEPHQKVDLAGLTAGHDTIEPGTRLFVEDIEGEATAEIVLEAGATSFEVVSLPVDLRTHCFEIWLISPDGRESDHQFARAHITDPKTLETVEGCD